MIGMEAMTPSDTELPENQAPNGVANRLGAAKNTSRGTGIPGWISTGSLPKGFSYARRICREFQRALEYETTAIHGKLSVYHQALCQSAARHEIRVRLCQRWLKYQAREMSDSDRLAYVNQIGSASDARDRCLKNLGLDKAPETLDVLYTDATPSKSRKASKNGTEPKPATTKPPTDVTSNQVPPEP